jgi:hypothetical protein
MVANQLMNGFRRIALIDELVPQMQLFRTFYLDS